MVNRVRLNLLDLADMVRAGMLKAARLQPAPALLRLITALAAAAALALAAPTDVLLSSRVLVLVPFALAPALFPRTRVVGITAVVVILLYAVDTIGADGSPPLWRVGLLAAALYLTHAGAAFAGGVPYDATVSGDVLRRWGLRVATVALAGAGLGLAGMVVVGRLPSERSLIGPIVGSVVAAVLVGLLALSARRH
jgi:hypothetical protein